MEAKRTHIRVRVPPDLLADFRSVAEANQSSANAEVLRLMRDRVRKWRGDGAVGQNKRSQQSR